MTTPEICSETDPIVGFGRAALDLYSRPPGLYPKMSVPAEVEGWLLRLLEKPVCARFQAAADARWSLEALPSASGTQRTMALVSSGVARSPSNPTLSLDSLDSESLLPDVLRIEPIDAPRPPFPTTWTPDLPPPMPMHLVDVGLRLYPLRDRPLAGRIAEREALVAALREVHHGQCIRAVLLEGIAGLGKSHLARWISERANERGLANTVLVNHGPESGRGDGVQGLLTTLGQPTHGRSSARFERIRVARASRALDRPTVLWLDDVQHSAETLGFGLSSADRRPGRGPSPAVGAHRPDSRVGRGS